MTEQQALHPDQSADSSQPTGSLWRKEIHARVAGYRNRRGRRIEGAFTMRFPFPSEEAMETKSTLEGADEPTVMDTAGEEMTEFAQHCTIAVVPPDAGALDVESAVITAPAVIADPLAIASDEPEVLLEAPASDPEPEPTPQPRPVPLPRPRTKRKVIAFPRQVSEAPAVHRLADPIVPEQPRILDVPEELEAYPNTPLLDGLQFFGSGQQAAAAHADHIELPFQAVSISQRLYAGFIDCAVVAAAAGIFGAVGYKMLPKLAFTKPVILTAAAIPVLLWAIYQYILTVYGGTTAGMRVAGVCLRSFKGTHPSWRHRRSRVIGLYFSTASLLMGLLWALVDVDMLCWHDRISRTYLTNLE
jgi:uncharacterized RDD family membrane protein YckC